MDLLIQRVVDGIENGTIYASLALAIVIVYRATGTLNLAQGEMAMFTTFIAWKVADPGSGLGWPIGVAILIAVVAGFAGGAGIERVFIRPLEKRQSHLPIIIVTLGLLLALDALAGTMFTFDTVTLASPFPSGDLRLGGIHVAYQTLGLLGVLAFVSVIVWYLFQRTRLGLAMRASVDNPESARLAGIPRGRMLMLGWGLAGAIGSLAGVLVAPSTLVSVGMMDGVLVYAFAAATLGGFDSAVGGVVGGLVLGILESLATGYLSFIGNQLTLFVALAVIVVVLLGRPGGILGSRKVARL